MFPLGTYLCLSVFLHDHHFPCNHDHLNVYYTLKLKDVAGSINIALISNSSERSCQSLVKEDCNQDQCVEVQTSPGTVLTQGVVKSRVLLQTLIDIDHGLLDELRRLKVLTDQQIGDCIELQKDNYGKVAGLLDCVVNSSDDRQWQFLLALERTRQRHVVSLLLLNGDQSFHADAWPIAACKERIATIDANWPELKDALDVGNGLLDELLSVDCISQQHKEYVESDGSNSARNDGLLKLMRRMSVHDYRKFIGCLARTRQLLAMSLLGDDAARNVRFLDEKRLSRLRKHQLTLLSLLDANGALVAQMISADCITDRQREFIEAATSRSKRNSRVLDIVRRATEDDFERFMHCLRSTGQRHVVSLVQSDDTVVPVMSASVNLTPREREIVDSFARLMSASSSERQQRIASEVIRQTASLADRGVPIICLRTEHSIGVLYLCTTLDVLRYLLDLHGSGELRTTVGDLFTLLLDAGQSVIVERLRWTASQYIRCSQSLHAVAGLSVFGELYAIALQQTPPDAEIRDDFLFDVSGLPMELSEMILVKTAVVLFVEINRLSPSAQVYVLATLCVVLPLWRELLTRRRFIRHQLRLTFRRICRPYRCTPRRVETSVSVGRPNWNVIGIAELNDELYVVSAKSNEVLVFASSPPFGRPPLRCVTVAGLTDPADIGACAQTGTLFVADMETTDTSMCVWQLHANAVAKDSAAEKFVSLEKLYTLSVNFGHLLVACYSDLFVYDTNGDADADGKRTGRRIRLPDGVLARHAVETRRHTYIVCHYPRLHGETRSDVTELNADGTLLRVYQRGRSVARLSTPRYALLNDYDDRDGVLVADLDTKRIVALDGDLMCRRTLLSLLEGQPNRICLSGSSRLLFVAYYQSGTIGVFDITIP